jgi:hypothetical protein
VYSLYISIYCHSFIHEDDLDGTKDRINDITFFDRNSRYDENVVTQTTDYLEIISGLKHLAKKYFSKEQFDVFQKDFESFLETTEAKSNSNIGDKRTYKDLLNCTFKLTKVVRIENASSYDDSISGKGSDFTSHTIRGLIRNGKEDASNVLGP